MSGRKGRRRGPRSTPREQVGDSASATEESEAAEETAAREETEAARETRPRRGPFAAALLGAGDSALPPVGRSLGRGFLAVASQPMLAFVAVVVPVAAWLALVAVGFEGVPSRLVDVLAMPPISTYFDLGTGASLYGIGPPLLVYLGVSVAVRTLVYAVLSGMIVEAVEDGRVTTYGILRGLVAIPAVLVVQVASFSLIVAGNLIFPVLGPGIGFLGFVSALVAGLFFLGFVPAAAIREGRPVIDTMRRSARAAMLPGGRHLLLCSLYFFLALPVVVGFAPGGGDITANPTLITWVFVLLVNVLHLAFMAAFAYRWIIAEPSVPQEPVRRRPPPRARAAGARRR